MNSIIFLTGERTNLRITLPIDCCKQTYAVRISSMNHPFQKGNDDIPFCPINYFFVSKNSDNILEFEYVFEYESEYIIYVNDIDEPAIKFDYYSMDKPIYKMSVFALNKDLFVLKPLKIDFHAHSNASDGTYSPQEVCAYYRENGFDAFALTDHYTINGSLKALEFYDGANIDLKLFLGEETHPVANDPHIVNWGCNKSVNDIIYNSNDLYLAQLKEIIAKYDLYSYRSPKTIANCIWRSNKIREFGGIAILAHPYWKLVTNTVEDEVINYIFDHNLVDAFELIGGNTIEDNNMQLNYYMQFLRSGRDIPILGNSDSHTNSAYFKEGYTVVLAKNNDKCDIIDAVKKRRTIVYEKNSADTQTRVYSDFRFVPFGHFLLREYFPLLQAQYKLEGELMRGLCNGDNTVKQKMVKQLGKIEFLQAQLYYKYEKTI